MDINFLCRTEKLVGVIGENRATILKIQYLPRYYYPGGFLLWRLVAGREGSQDDEADQWE